jgi:hypothetical protein
MAINSAMVVFADASPLDALRAYPVLDKPATRALAERLFPGAVIEEAGDQLLVDALDPPENVAYVGCYPGVDLVCCWGFMPDRPSQLGEAVLNARGERRNVFLYGLHGDADWCTFGIWEGGELKRSLSACPDPGIIEDVGEHLGFEQQYWDHEPFRPLDLGEAALHALLGIVVDGQEKHDDVDPELIPVVGYRITMPVAAAPEGVTAGGTAAADSAR